MAQRDICTFGDVRRMILDTIIELKEDRMDVSRGMAIAANMKVLNDSIQVEINAAKMSLAAINAGKDFGDVIRLGKRSVIDGVKLISDDRKGDNQ